MARSRWLRCGAGVGFVLLAACEQPKTYETTVEILQVQRFGADPKAPGLVDLELRYRECPGEARRLVRADKAFSACVGDIRAGDERPVTVTMAWNAERGTYRSSIVRLGDCPLQMDPREEANYESVQVCTDLVATGAVVGVRCDRTRPRELVEKCPWLRRR